MHEIALNFKASFQIPKLFEFKDYSAFSFKCISSAWRTEAKRKQKGKLPSALPFMQPAVLLVYFLALLLSEHQSFLWLNIFFCLKLHFFCDVE